MTAQRDPVEHARRLIDFRHRTERTTWVLQPNGEWWLVPVLDGSSSSPSPD